MAATIKNLNPLPIKEDITNGISAIDIYPAVIVNALNGSGVKPAIIIIKKPCTRKRSVT